MSGVPAPKTVFVELVICPEIKEVKTTVEQIKIPLTQSIIHLRRILQDILNFKKQLGKEVILVMRKNDHKTKNLLENIKLLNMKNLPKIIVIGKDIKIIKEDEKELKILIMNDHHILPTTGHAGINRMLNTIKQRYTWKGIDSDVRNMVKHCKECQVNKTIVEPKVPLQITSTASEPMQKIYLDLVGPLVKAEGYEYILTTQCDLTKFMTATAITDKKTETVAKAFTNSVLLKYGIPESICTDRGTEFMSKLFEELCKCLHIRKLNSTAYHHESIAPLENSHKMLGNFLRIYCKGNPLAWKEWIQFYEFAYNNTVHSATGYTPFFLMYGRIPNIPSHYLNDQRKNARNALRFRQLCEECELTLVMSSRPPSMLRGSYRSCPLTALCLLNVK